MDPPAPDDGASRYTPTARPGRRLGARPDGPLDWNDRAAGRAWLAALDSAQRDMAAAATIRPRPRGSAISGDELPGPSSPRGNAIDAVIMFARLGLDRDDDGAHGDPAGNCGAGPMH